MADIYVFKTKLGGYRQLDKKKYQNYALEIMCFTGVNFCGANLSG